MIKFLLGILIATIVFMAMRDIDAAYGCAEEFTEHTDMYHTCVEIRSN